MKHIYFDHNASAKMRPEVCNAMIDCFAHHDAHYGNASSLHHFGRQARGMVEAARSQIAALINTTPQQVIFTSGASEANATILSPYHDDQILISSIEHPSVLVYNENTSHYIRVTQDGIIDLDHLADLLRQRHDIRWISVMLVNNETGVIQPVEKIRDIITQHAMTPDPNMIKIHCDATQAIGRIDVDFNDLHIDAMSISAHKIGGPQGVGALITRPGLTFPSLIKGGGQERRQRAGTENVAGIVGFGVAASMASHGRDTISHIRDGLETAILDLTPDAIIFGQNAPRVGNTCCLALPNITAQSLVLNLDLEGIAVSSGSACSSGVTKASHVVAAMGYPQDLALNAIRISLGWHNSQENLDEFIKIWSKITKRLAK